MEYQEHHEADGVFLLQIFHEKGDRLGREKDLRKSGIRLQQLQWQY